MAAVIEKLSRPFSRQGQLRLIYWQQVFLNSLQSHRVDAQQAEAVELGDVPTNTSNFDGSSAKRE